jgi:hypothetical protein
MNYETRFLIALLVTVVVETLGLCLMFRLWWKKDYQKIGWHPILSAGVIASSLTLPYLWFVLPAFLGRPLFIVVGEFLVFFAEGLIYKRVLPISYAKAFSASLTLNLLSIAAGKFLLPFLA